MNDVETLLTTTYDHHAGRLGDVAGEAGDVTEVYRRVSRRRTRRRTLTAVASIALIAVGIGGIVAVGQIDRDTPGASAPGDAAGDPGYWFVCSSELSFRDGSRGYDDCWIESGVGDTVWQCDGPVPGDWADDVRRLTGCRVVGDYAELVSDEGQLARCAPTTVVPVATTPGVTHPVDVDDICPPNNPTPAIPPGCAPATWVPSPATTAPGVQATNPPPPTTYIEQSCVQVPAPTAPAGTTPPCENLTVATSSTGRVWDGCSPVAGTAPPATDLPVFEDACEQCVTTPTTTAPGAGCAHTIVTGDTPAKVAADYGVTVEELQARNPELDVTTWFDIGREIFVAPCELGRNESAALLAIGDSVMLSAADVLKERGYYVDAAVSRQLGDIVPVVEQLASAEVLGDVVVLHLGNNSTITAAELDAILDSLAEVPNVILLTSHIDRSWAEPNNQLIRAADDRPNVIVIDWATLADDCPGECFADDGYHLADDGATYYADLIRDVTGA